MNPKNNCTRTARPSNRRMHSFGRNNHGIACTYLAVFLALLDMDR